MPPFGIARTNNLLVGEGYFLAYYDLDENGKPVEIVTRLEVDDFGLNGPTGLAGPIWEKTLESKRKDAGGQEFPHSPRLRHEVSYPPRPKKEYAIK